MVPPNETGSISEPVFFALRYNYLFRPYSTILSGRLHTGNGITISPAIRNK